MGVALRKESVDRKDVIRPAIDVFLASLSARRAWIEKNGLKPSIRVAVSLSARRAWIENGLFGTDTVSYQVALRKESVDRKEIGITTINSVSGRSPQGERG